MNKLLCFSILAFCFSLYAEETPQCLGVTYEFSGGRLGDNLLTYFHAKWVSYKYGIPIFYREFPYSTGLRIHLDGLHFPEKEIKMAIVNNQQEIESSLKEPAILLIPYFPESQWERDHAPERGFQFAYFPVDWEDKEFKKTLKLSIEPVVELEKIDIPNNAISVACHLRRGGGFDPMSTCYGAALKFPQDNFFITEIQWLVHLFPQENLYVYLFTDDPHPQWIKKKFEQIFRNSPVTFECRSNTNHHTLHILDDFFSLTKFDCSIHGESNYSICAAKISDYLVECQPTHFHWEGQTLIIDRVLRKIRKTKLEQYTHDPTQLHQVEILK